MGAGPGAVGGRSCGGAEEGWDPVGVRWESGRETGADGDDDDILAGVWFVLMWACRRGSH